MGVPPFRSDEFPEAVRLVGSRSAIVCYSLQSCSMLFLRFPKLLVESCRSPNTGELACLTLKTPIYSSDNTVDRWVPCVCAFWSVHKSRSIERRLHSKFWMRCMFVVSCAIWTRQNTATQCNVMSWWLMYYGATLHVPGCNVTQLSVT